MTRSGSIPPPCSGFCDATIFPPGSQVDIPADSYWSQYPDTGSLDILISLMIGWIMLEQEKRWNLTQRWSCLGILLGLGFIGSQIPDILLNHAGLDNNRAYVFSILIIGIGVMISVISFHIFMSNTYQTSCLIPPEWKNFMRDGKESLSIKGIIVLYMIQWIFLIPVIFSMMVLWTINPGRHLPIESFILFALYFFFVFCGYLIYSFFTKTRRRCLNEEKW